MRGLLSLWEDPEQGAPLRALIAGVAHDDAFAVLVKEMIEREMVGKLADRIGGADARQRAGAFCAQLAGLIVTRYLLRLEPIASMAPDELVRLCTPPPRLTLR
ncbi:TetR/AcrR family transcriptional regulator [Amycolatopsis pigmentata]|uniref:Tetracyclin repressor-like C-terminal domain-containing protein n=1 Tax=Amycolatopsis pigmentata TaxID=450801 RepID=A0ABW5FSZ6_9PSEU